MPALDLPEFERWMAASLDELDSASVLAEAGRHSHACFHCEQSAQLALKALLHGLGVGAWGHDAAALGRRCSEELGPLWPAELESRLARLSRHYIPSRYPDAHASGTPALHYGAEDSKTALDDARLVRQAASAAWAALAGAEEKEGRA